MLLRLRHVLRVLLPLVQLLFLLLKKTITPIYRKINVTELKHEKPASKDVKFLEDAYKEEKNNIEKLLGIHVPW